MTKCLTQEAIWAGHSCFKLCLHEGCTDTFD